MRPPRKPGKSPPVSPAKTTDRRTFLPRPQALPDTLPVPPSVTPVCVAGEAGPVPGGCGQDAGRFPGAGHEGSPSRLKQGGACLWGTHDWTGDWRGSPLAFRAAAGTARTNPRAPPWIRCRHPRRETEFVRQKTPNGTRSGVMYSYLVAARDRVPAEYPSQHGGHRNEAKTRGRMARVKAKAYARIPRLDSRNASGHQQQRAA